MIRSCAILIALLALLPGPPASAVDTSVSDIPGDSVYRLPGQYVDHRDRPFRLAELRGDPVLITLFYTSCRYICPLIVDSIRGVDLALPVTQRQRLRVVLVTLDPERDTPAVLRDLIDRRRLDAPRWTLVRTQPAQLRPLAAALGIRYRALADGEFNHSSAMVLLDADGRRLATAAAAGPTPSPAFLDAVRAALAAAPAPRPHDKR